MYLVKVTENDRTVLTKHMTEVEVNMYEQFSDREWGLIGKNHVFFKEIQPDVIMYVAKVLH